MKTILRTTMLLALVVGLSACGNNKRKGAQFNDRGTRATGVSDRAKNGVKPETVVYADQSMSYWMDAVKRLVSPSIAEEYLVGTVSPEGRNGTGVYICARLCLQGSTIPNHAMVVLHVYDEYEGQKPVPIYLNAVGGTYNQSTGRIQAEFRDAYGGIYLEAQVYSGGNVEGYVSFDTRVRYDGSRDTRGWQGLGRFYMNANSLFSCY